MSCNFIYINGKLEVRADNGSPSLLFEKAKKVFGEEMAKEVFLVSKSDQFQDVFKSTVEVMQKRLLRKFDSLRVVEQLKPVSEKTFEIPKFTYNEEIGRIKGVDVKEEDGATFNLDGTTYQDGGLVVPLESFNTTQEDLTKEDIDDFIEAQKEKIGDNIVKVGIYKFPNSNRVSVDLSIVVLPKYKDVAIAFGKYAGQESLYNLDTGKNEKTEEDGKNPKTFTAEEFKIIAEKLSRGENPSEYLNNKNGRERTRWDESRGNQTLEGAPIIKGATGADAELTLIAEEYAKSKGITYNRQPAYVEVDEKLAKRIADAYEDMKHDPQDPKVKEAYENLIRQTTEQYNFLVKNGYTFDFFDSETDPYEGNPWNAMRDLRNNKKMSVYGTYDGYGAEGVTEGSVEDNPMLADTGLKWKDQNGKEHAVLANDLFRCFTPETLVRTSEGFKEIQYIKVGDLVLTHEGRFKKVYETIKNLHKGEILNISTNASYNPIRVTPEHPFYVLKGNHGEQKSSICTPYICDRKQPNGNTTPQEKYHTFDWVEAKDLKEKTWFPLTVDTVVRDLDFIEIPDKHYVGKTTIPKKIELTEDFLSFVGLYIAEGSGGTNRINISLHKDEQYLIDLVDRFAKSIGYNVKSRVVGNGITLQINCKILKNWFSEWLGRGSTNKKIPNEFLQLPPEKLKHIAYGIFSGDGKKTHNCIEQTSLTLALQLVEVGSRLGMQPTTNKINLSKNVNHSDTYTTHEFLKTEHNFKQKKYTWKILNKDCRSITKIDKEYYEGFVYNIEVEDDHSYVVENVPVHNCVHDAFGHGLEGSGFRARGEENAWQSHVRLFTGSAVGAITSETRGQNSWLNYGKFGKQNQTAKIEDTVFAEQKVGLMPEWTWTEGVDKGKPLQGGAVFSKFFEKVTNTEKGGAKFNNVLDVLSKPIEGFEKELEAYLKYGMNFQKHIMASIPGFVDARIRVLKGMVEASKIIAKGGEINMLDITSSEGYYTKAYAQLAQDAGVDAKADALDAGVSFQRDFYKAPQVKGVNYLLQAWGDSFVDPASGQAIPSFKAKKKYGVVFEGMGFQFFTPTRDKEIKEVKSLMSPEGLFVTMEKLKNKDYDKREVAKDEFKSQFFTQDEIKEKQKSILKKDDSSVGMMDYQFDRKAYEKVLSDNFKYVVQIYSSGNFAGYYASDNLEVIQTALKNTGDTTTKFNEEVTPNIIKTDTNSILENNKLKSQSTGSKIIETKGAKLYFKDRVNPFNNKPTGEIELELVESSIKGQGNAKKAITDFLNYTDSLSKPVYLAVSPRDKTTTEKGLIKLYESFGFRLDSSGFEMTRKPKKVSLPIQDKNGEPILEEVTKFMTSQNRSKETLTVDQQADMLNLMASKGVASVEILKAKIKKAFYNEYGVFELNFDKLVASGLYTKAEARMINERFEEVKQTVEALQNTDLNLTVDILENTEITFEYTSFGTLKRVPLQIEEEKNTEVLDSNLENIPDNNTLDKLVVASKVNDSAGLLIRLEKLLNKDNVVLNDDVQVTMEALSDIADAFIPLGINVQRLEELASDEDLKPFVAILTEFARKPNKEVRRAFSEAYNEKFGISVQPKKVKTSEDKKYFVVDDSTMTEQEIFEQKNLIKHAPNLYYKVIRESVEVLLEKLNLTKDKGALEREAMTQEGYNNAEIALEVLLYKKSFKSPTKVIKQENVNLDNFTGDFNYLTDGFVADFHVDMIKEEKSNSKKWNNFYSLFDFNDKGLFIKNEDSYSMSMIELYADENLRQYSLISRQMPNLVVEEQEVNSLQKDRDVIVNNSDILPLYKGTSYSIDASNVILKGATSKFIKLQDGVYEAVQNNGDLTLYSKLEITKEEYYQVGVKQPTPNIDINDYNNLKNTPEKFIKNSNLKSKEEKDKIKRNNFDCL